MSNLENLEVENKFTIMRKRGSVQQMRNYIFSDPLWSCYLDGCILEFSSLVLVSLFSVFLEISIV